MSHRHRHRELKGRSAILRLLRVCVCVGGGLGADLSEESDWLLAHSMCIANVGFDDLSKRLLHALQNEKHKGQK